MLKKDNADRVKLDLERCKHWLSVGAQPTDRVARLLDAAGLVKRTASNNPDKAKPKKKRLEREAAQAEKAAKAAEAAAAARPSRLHDVAVGRGAVDFQLAGGERAQGHSGKLSMLFGCRPSAVVLMYL